MANPVDAKQLAAATNALLSFIHSEKKKNNNLLDDDAFISLIVTLQRTPEKARTKPFYAPLAHSLYKDRPVCLITSDGLYKSVKETLKTTPVEGIEKVIGITKLKKEFGQFADKRKLSNSYDLFLADARLMHLLPKLIGAKFFDKKKHPSLIDLDKSNIIPSLVKARDATYFHLPAGPTIMIKIARTSFSDTEIIENFNAAIDAIVNHIPKKWKGIQALYLRTATSVALPFYNSLPFTLKIQDSDTPQLTLQSNSKRKAVTDETETSSKKPALSLSSAAASSTPFTTLTLTGVKPEAEETLTPDTPVALKPKKKLLKRKSLAPSAATAQSPVTVPATPAASGTVPAVTPVTKTAASPAAKPTTQKKASQKKTASLSPAAVQPQATPAQKKASQKKSVTATPAPEQVTATPAAIRAPPTTQKKAKTSPGPPQVAATPGPSKVVNTPKPKPTQSPASGSKALSTPTSGPKKAGRKSTVKKHK